MTDFQTLTLYITSSIEILLEFANAAKADADQARQQGHGNDFKAGYLMGLNRAVSLLQQQADAHDIALAELGLGGVDPNRDLT